MKRFTRMLAAGVVGLTATVLAAEPAHAWKPRTHVYLAEQALQDALDDGKVTIYETDYRTGKILGTLGAFPVDPKVLAALKQYPKQYRAGVLGPDAYPDIATGQQIVHPNASHALDQHATAQGTNSWLTYLWDRAYGSKQLTVLGALALQRNDTPAIRAFVTGYMTHAAGDMFAHTFVNHFSGGEFMLTPDPRNALKHLILEAYIGKRTPAIANAATEDVISIDGVSGFIYREMVWAFPGSPLEQKLFQGDGTSKSIPAIFSKLRNELQKDVTKYDNLLSGKERMSPANNLWLVTEGPKIEHKRRWMFDIDKGLKAWPQFSHELGKALVFNEQNGGTDLTRAKALTSDYVKNYLVYMGPVPDFVIDGTKLMMAVIDKLTPTIPYLKELLAELKKDALNYIVRSATGRTTDEWSAYMKNPEQHFDPILNSAGGEHPGRTAQRMTLSTFNRDYLKINDPGFSNPAEKFKIEAFPPAFNTVQMCKLLLLGPDGVNQLLTALSTNNTPKPNLPANFANVMLGWLQSLDNDNQWQGLTNKASNPNSPLLFAQNGGATYQRIFMRQVGEADWVTAPAPANSNTAGNNAAPTEAQIALMDRFAGEWQNVTTGPGGSVTMTFKRDGGILRGTTQTRGMYTDNLHPGAVFEARASADGTRLEAEWWIPSDVAGYIPRRGTFQATLRPDGDTFAGEYHGPERSEFFGANEWTATRKKPVTEGGTGSAGGAGTGNTGAGTTTTTSGNASGSYTLGIRFPIPITIKSLRYSVEPVNIGDETIAPHADEKLLVIYYTVKNGSNEVRHFDNDNVRMYAVDSDNASHPYADRVGLERSRREVGTDLDINGSLDLYTVIVLPAEGEAKKLIIEPTHSGEEKGRATMDLSGKVSPLPAPFSDPADASGATARPVVPAEAGTFYPMGFYDVRLDLVAIDAGRLTTIFTIKNRSTLRQSFDNGTFLPTVHDTAGDVIEWDGTIYHATKSGPAGTEIEPGSEYRIRFRFPLGDGIAPKTFSLSEHFGGKKTRAYTFDVTTARTTN